MGLAKIKQENNCNECGNPVIDNSRFGQKACSVCGLIASEKEIITNQSDVKAFTQEEINRRVHFGPPITPFKDIGTMTIVPKKETNNYNLKRAFKWHYTKTNIQKSKEAASVEIRRLGSKHSLPPAITESAMTLFNKTREARLLKGNSIKAVVIACLYQACQENDSYRQIKEINDHIDITVRSIRKIHRNIVKLFSLRTSYGDASFYVTRFTSELNIDPHLCEDIFGKLRQLKTKSQFLGKSPKGIAAGIIYYVCKSKNEKISQKEIAHVAGITENTIRSRYKDIIKTL